MLLLAVLAAVSSAGVDKQGNTLYRTSGKIGDCSTQVAKAKKDPCRAAEVHCNELGGTAVVSFSVGDTPKAPGQMVVTFRCKLPAPAATPS
ncbi:MAG: hypothetical protein DI570_09995 [Phenylobacterium zucineum]|nr:MAG: hypothetical protein DI570_09995 [Phenylobacterium zucineum]